MNTNTNYDSNISGNSFNPGDQAQAQDQGNTVPDILTFKRHDVRRLEIAYKKALMYSKNSFEFKGHTLYTPYAKYLLLYMKQKFNTMF